MKRPTLLTVVALFASIASIPSLARARPQQPLNCAGQYYTPHPGSAERRGIMDALRGPVSRISYNRGKRVVFTHVELLAANGWAYVEAESVDAKGKQLGPPITSMVSALLHGSGSRWRVMEWAYATDVISIEWEHKYPQVPRLLWPHRRH